MRLRSPAHWLVWAVMLVSMSVYRPEVASADEESECLAAHAEGQSLSGKGDYAGAARAYERALELAPQVFGAESENTATILSNLGIAYKDMGEHAKAESAYQRSLGISESPTTLNNLAVLYWNMGQYAKAEPIYQRCLAAFEAQFGSDDPKVATVAHNLGTLYMAMGEYTQAEPLFERGFKIRQSTLAPDHPDIANSLNGLALLYKKTGDVAKAEPMYEQCLKIWEAQLGPEHPLVGTVLHNLATLYMDTGQYAKATPLFERSLKLREAKLGPNHPDVASTLNNLASLYDDLGQYAKAEPMYQRSLKTAESQLGPNHPDVARVLNNLAVLYQKMGQYAKAVPLYERSLKMKESQLGPKHPDVAATINNLAVLYSNTGEYEKALPLCERSLKLRESELGVNHPDVAASLTNLAEVYKHLGQYAKAEPLQQRSRKIAESQLGPNHPDVATILHNLADLYTVTERWPEAVAETEQERRIVRRHVARTLPALSENEQLTFLRVQDETHLHSALSLGLHRRTDAEGALRSAGWVLNGKAVAQEVLAQRAILSAEAADPTAAELVKQLLEVRRQLATQSLARPKAGQEAEYRQKLQSLSQQEQELSRQFGQRTGRAASDDPWVEPESVRKALAKDAVLIEIARFRVWGLKEKNWLPPHYVAWVMPAEKQGSISIVDLGEAQPIDDAVQSARKALEQSEKAIHDDGERKAEKGLREAMRGLTRFVLGPLESHFGNSRQLIVSPDSALWLVPWGALPLSDDKYAIEKYAIRYVISGRDLVSQTANKDRLSNNPILFANPDYDLGVGEADATTRAILRGVVSAEPIASSRGLASLGALPRVGRLPGTAEEAAAIKPNIARYAGTDPVVYEDRNALEGVFKAIHSPRVLVLSTHGFFMPDQQIARKDERSAGTIAESSINRAALTAEGKPFENPLLRCGLLLAGCNQRVENAPAGVDDGVLTGLEIVGTDLRGTELVVLSACETGLGEVRNGEGVAGLRQAFRLAGVGAVVSTLWQIPDTETVELVNVFFANLSSGQSQADALRNAQLAQIKTLRQSKSAAHPYYWAAFTLTGTP